MMDMNLQKERFEAIEAGRRALGSLEAARKDLKSARNWGLLDLLGRRSFMASMIRQSRMQDAQQHLDQARYDLGQFSLELNDVNAACDLNIHVGDFLSFADVFLDNFYVDWAIQTRIRDAAEQVENAIGMVEDILARLEQL